ncbi:MAG TPA: 3D-(3,5/4)-trihydroxycyclohexane-1,2-dione acylhydrolase (decyclizing) [Gaiellaceae bacterium]|nr:3D-(3,5/4)-trihydroxycyclohexane-1,2-dione acylhydrolase (decyclizing) [Gaiellaceae bacterium]
MTAAQALLRFLAAQHVERDGVEHRFFGGCFGIFGHGNVAGFGEALFESPELLRYRQAKNEQAMVHAAAGYAKMRNRLGALVCTTSIGPGATNMVTGAALATVNRLPVLLVPGDVFASRRPDPVLQQLETPWAGDLSVNEALRPVSRYFDRIWRPEQVGPAALAAMRVLVNQAETGAATLAFPQDVQTEAWDYPEELFEKRVWHVPRQLPDEAALGRAVARIREASRPLVVAGGGVVYSEATEALARFSEQTGIPVGETQAGKGSLPYDRSLGGIGATGTRAANRIAAEADLVIGIGTRWSDFTTASRTAFPAARAFVEVNVADLDAHKYGGVALVGDARATLERLTADLAGWQVEPAYREEWQRLVREWDEEVGRLYALGHGPLPAQSEVIGAVNDASGPRDVVVCAAGSMPGDLHKLWRTRDPKGYHLEYGYSCMGYEIAGGLGAKLAAPDREVYVLVGDGSYLMLSSEIATAVEEGLKLVIVLVDSRGFKSIGSLSESVGAQRFGTERGLELNLAANAASLGAHVLRAETVAELRAALEAAKAEERTTVVAVAVDRDEGVPSYESWWDVPVAEVSAVASVRAARERYEAERAERS